MATGFPPGIAVEMVCRMRLHTHAINPAGPSAI
jgi:hypothetical protein